MSSKKPEADRTQGEQQTLAMQYREIGPAALVAALLCAAKKGKSANEKKKAA
ncbi:MAG: transcriptional regulator [Methylobacterium mesophilicum]|nr:transcriptional regulator [Methylobacterium mesophilicum]